MDASFDTLATLEPCALPVHAKANDDPRPDGEEAKQADNDNEDDDVVGKRWRAVISRLQLRPMAAALAAAFERGMAKLPAKDD